MAKHDAQILAFFSKRPRLAATPAGRVAVLQAQWRTLVRLQAQVRSQADQIRTLRSARSLHRRAEWDPEAARELGWVLARQRGWSRAEFDCVDRLFGPLESSWRVHADNPRSDAYGIPQALPGLKMGPGWETDARVQILWGFGYVEGRFGGPCGALSFRLSNGFY